MPADADFVVLDARIDLKNWNKAIAQMEADARSMESKTILVDVKINDSGLKTIQGQLNKVDTDITADVKFTTSGDDIANLREQWDDPLVAKVKFEQTGDDIVSLRDAFDDTIQADVKFTQTGDNIAGMLDDLQDVTVDVKANEDASVDTTVNNVEKKLDDLKTLAKIELILNAAEFVKGVEALPLVGALVELEELTHQVAGQTGRDLENTGRIINNVWTGNWGESKAEIAEVVKLVAQLRDENGNFMFEAGAIEDVVVGAYQAAAVGGKEATETLRAASQLVKNNTVPSMEEAFDFIATGFSLGFDSSGDFLDTLTEYSVTFQDARLGAQGLFNIIKSGTETGIFNTDKMGDAFKEMFNLTKEEWALYEQSTDNATDRTKAIQELGLGEEAAAFTAGEMGGDAFAQAVIDALNEKFEDPANQQRLAKAIFSPTMVEDAGLANLLQTNLAETNIWKGQAKILSDEIFSGPGSAFQTMQRTLETHFLNALMNSVEAQEFMDKITAAAQRFGTELASGAGIGEALEIALEMPGLNDQISRLESVLGNFVIDFMTGIASIGEALGQDMSGIREAVARFGAGQLSFDIQTAQTEDDIAAAVQRAISRGASSADISSAVSQGFSEVLTEGDVSKAQAIVDAFTNMPDVELGSKAQSVLEAAGDDVDVAVTALTKVRDELSSNILTASTPAVQAQVAELDNAISQLESRFVTVDTTTMQMGVDTLTNDLSQGLIDTVQSGDYANAATIAGSLLDTSNPDIQAKIDDFATTLLIQFNNALATGDTETASDILTILGLSPDTNELVLSSMEQRLADFAKTGGYHIDTVETGFSDLGAEAETTGKKGAEGVNTIYDAILGERGVLGVTRLDSLAKRFDAVGDAIKGALKEIAKAEDQVGSGTVEGAAVGGIRGQGVTLVGEAGRELIFSDERFAVLNNQTTDRLYTALANMGGVTNSSTSNRTVHYSPTVIVQNDAQAALFGHQAFNQLRGEAF